MNISLQKKIYQNIKYYLLQRHVYGITSPVRITPDFLVIGAKRCGTTSLYEYLGKHPSIKKSFRDHIGFFDSNFHLGLNYYKSFFPTIFEKKFFENKNRKFLNYDVTSTYIENSITAKRVFDTLPNSKIIAIIRNPIDRAYSEYNVDKEMNPEIETFETFVDDEIEKNDISSNRKNYLKKGFWFLQLKPWFELFPRKNILILSTEEFGRDANHVFNTIFEFLELERFSIKNPKKFRKGNYSKLNDKTRDRLTNFFRPHNIQFYDLVGKNFDWEK